MKIKTKTGKIIDLNEARARFTDIFAQFQEHKSLSRYDSDMCNWAERCGVELLDALDAVLSVKERRYWEAGCHDGGSLAGWNDCVEEVRKLAGVVEE